MANEFDPATLAQLKSDLDVDTVKEILASYLQEGPQLLAEAQAALRRGHLPDFQRAVHTLKSTSANVGAIKLSEAAKALEIGARGGKMPSDDAPLLELARLLEAVTPRLTSWNG